MPAVLPKKLVLVIVGEPPSMLIPATRLLEIVEPDIDGLAAATAIPGPELPVKLLAVRDGDPPFTVKPALK
jgi:hypothetical protein